LEHEHARFPSSDWFHVCGNVDELERYLGHFKYRGEGWYHDPIGNGAVLLVTDVHGLLWIRYWTQDPRNALREVASMTEYK
jgi:hypothetical protein